MFLIALASTLSSAQEKVTPRFDYITSDAQAQILISPSLKANELYVNGNKTPFDYTTERGMGLISVQSSAMTQQTNQLVVVSSDRRDTLHIDKLEPKANAIRIDHLTGVIQADGKDLIPCGYYAYSPIQEGLLEEELAQGMNLFSPYQHIEGKTLKDRLAYLDRCAELGIKVNYNMLNIAGGGGGSRASYKNDQERYALLEAEIRAIKDHPALLGWYIADEPDGQGISEETLEAIYARIKAIDPYHPVSIVILNAAPGRRYANSCDIMMCDPYPIPNGSPVEVIDAVDGLHRELQYEKAIWYVPQTFGGNEWWLREPTPTEIRMMNWSAAAYGARGFQAFIRHGLSSFPKDPAMWNSYTKSAREIQHLTPVFSKGERYTPRVHSTSAGVRSVGYTLGGEMYVIAINTLRENAPVRIAFDNADGEVYEYFENLHLESLNGVVEDYLAPYQVKIYRQFNNPRQLRAYLGARDLNKADNMVNDPSFEWGYSVAAHLPAASYSARNGERGAIIALDSRFAYDGENSLRLSSPDADGGRSSSLMFLQLQEGKDYTMSFWARTDARTLALNPKGVKLQVNFCKMKTEVFTLTDQWQQFTISSHYAKAPAYIRGVTPDFRLLSKGDVWIDMCEVVSNMNILSKKIEGTDQFEVSITNNIEGAKIHYTLDGSEPTASSALYSEPMLLRGIVTVRAAQIKDGETLGEAEYFVASHKAINREVALLQPFTKYSGGGAKALTDGIMATSDFRNPHWQGYIDGDMETVVDMGEVQQINKISLSTLHSSYDWIVPPTAVEFFVSEDGRDFKLIERKELGEAKDEPSHKMLITTGGISATGRYIKVVAERAEGMPKWHSRDDAWLFVDEIIVE